MSQSIQIRTHENARGATFDPFSTWLRFGEMARGVAAVERYIYVPGFFFFHHQTEWGFGYKYGHFVVDKKSHRARR